MKIQKVYSFECDRCHAELTGDTKIAIFARESRLENPKKKFDLCEKCYRAFIKAMEKGVKNGKNDARNLERY